MQLNTCNSIFEALKSVYNHCWQRSLLFSQYHHSPSAFPAPPLCYVFSNSLWQTNLQYMTRKFGALASKRSVTRTSRPMKPYTTSAKTFSPTSSPDYKKQRAMSQTRSSHFGVPLVKTLELCKMQYNVHLSFRTAILLNQRRSSRRC